jgi:hypothetical protein
MFPRIIKESRAFADCGTKGGRLQWDWRSLPFASLHVEGLKVELGGGYTPPFLHGFEKKGVAKWVPGSA